MSTFVAHPRALARYLALRADPELGSTLRSVEEVLCDLDEPIRASTMALLVAVPLEHCIAIARELLGYRRPGARVDWHRLVDLAHVEISRPPLARPRKESSALRMVRSA